MPAAKDTPSPSLGAAAATDNTITLSPDRQTAIRRYIATTTIEITLSPDRPTAILRCIETMIEMSPCQDQETAIHRRIATMTVTVIVATISTRSEERRVGKE